MPFSINEIRSQLQFGGARPTLFDVVITPPTVLGQGLSELQFLCRASQIPSATVGQIEVPYFGRKIKVAGDRVFPDWQVTIINDEDFTIRNAMERWVSLINPAITNRSDTSFPSQYKGRALVTQYGKNGSVLRRYGFDGIFPTEVTPIDLAWDATDQIEEFLVNFAYDFNVVETSTSPGPAPRV